MGFAEMTDVQKQTIPAALKGQDLLAVAKTGSGKTLAFLIPAAETLLRSEHRGAARVLIISPTRELAIQTCGVSQALLKNLDKFSSRASTALLVGGTKKAHELEELRKGCSVIVATPGRLLDHLKNGLSLSRVKLVVLDESDRILDIGFERDMNSILSYIPSRRQTMLFSATSGENALARNWLRPGFATIEVHKHADAATTSGLLQSYVLCPEGKRFSLLFSLLRKSRDQKAIVFFSTCSSVVFHSELFVLLGFKIGALHGGVKQDRRARVFAEFCSSKAGILFSTDVAARGLDVPGVSWIVQYDPPTDPKEYIHRVGRTARAGKGGNALLFLLPHEKTFVKYLEHLKVFVEEWGFREPRDITDVFIKTVGGNYYLEKSAKEALKSYLQAYTGHKLKRVFDANKIELNGISRSFGLERMPKIDLTIAASGSSRGSTFK